MILLGRGFCRREEHRRVDLQSPRKDNQFDDIDPSLTAFHTRDEGLMTSQA